MSPVPRGRTSEAGRRGGARTRRFPAHVARLFVSHLRGLRNARERVKQVIEGPDGDIDRFIRSVRENSGSLSNKLLKEFPALAEEALAGEVLVAIETALAPPGSV